MAKYHHGDLRNTLIQIATELLEEEGIHSLSLRKIAQKAGVSHNAPYMHFADKEAVLAAIAEAGFRQLTSDVTHAVTQSANNARAQLTTACQVYLRFALTHPNHLQVMFRAYDLAQYPTLATASQASLENLFKLVEAGQHNGELKPGDPHAITQTIWSLAHGIASISITYDSQNLGSEPNASDEVIATFMNFLFEGLSSD